MNQITLLTQKLSLPKQERIEDIRLIRQNIDDIIICVRQGRELIIYRYVASTETWSQHWRGSVFGGQGSYPLDRYPWMIAGKLLNDTDVIILQHPDGVRLYKPNWLKPGLQLLKEDNHFHEVAGYNLSWGRFYPDTDEIGVIARNNGGVNFYVIGRDSLWDNTTYPLFPLGSDFSVPPTWNAAGTELFVTRLRHNDPATIGLRTVNGLEFYQFNADYVLEKVLSTSQIGRSTPGTSSQDRLFFCNLTHQKYQDILHLNGSGLHIFQYNDIQEDYRFLHRDTSILPSYSDSIRLTDLNRDGRDDLVLTGLLGLTAMSFDTSAKSWKNLIDPEHLSGSQRFAHVVGILPAMPPAIADPSIFAQDTEGNLLWAKVIPAPIPTTTAATPTTSRSTNTRLPIHKNTLVPGQIPRKAHSEKAPLRWSEQWDDRFLKEAVDPASGQVHLNIPLIDIFPSTGWMLQLALSYDGQRTTSDLLGVGWSMPIAQDFIIVDYQASIYPKDAQYYLVAQGQSLRLKLSETEEGVQRFKLAKTDDDLELTISYHLSAQRWIIENEAQQTTYGKASHSDAQDALQWSLGWPNWRGVGRNKAQQEPLITAWYLNMRLDKDNERTLYYYYEKDQPMIEGGKTYDAALRLKTISDGQKMRLDFDYASKESGEYTPPEPVDKSGNIVFPIPLVQSHYLSGYSITTDTFSQTLQFSYQVKDGNRLLTAIQQPLSPQNTEQVLNFSYQMIVDRPMLEGCSSISKGLTVHFDYQSIAQPTPNLVYDYPVRETAKMAYGSDFAVMAYRDLNPTAGQVIVRIMNQSMTQTMIDCSVSTELSCPSAESEIKDYAVQAYQDSFIVFTESNDERTLNVFNRQDETWSKNPSVHRFGKKALIRYSETLIVAAEPNEKNIMLHKRLDNRSGWSKQTLALSQPITALAVHNGLVVGYYDSHLWVFRHDLQAGWESQLIHYLPNGINHVLDLFELDKETRQEFEAGFNQNSLQIINNFILFNTIGENNGRFSSHTHLFLLDSRYNPTTIRLFKTEREHIDELTHEIQYDGSVFKLGYVKQSGRFKLQVKAISGKIIEDIIRNNRVTNIKIKEDIRRGTDDRVTSLLAQMNESEGWKGPLSKSLLIKWDLYAAHISQLGAYVGNDTLLRLTGVDWERETLPRTSTHTTPLGKHFVLESDDENRSLFKLYKQSSNGNKYGQPIHELRLHAPGQLINKYPAYIAYQPATYRVEVLPFKDEKTLGQMRSFTNEQLHTGSDLQNFMTQANSSSTEQMNLRVRPVPTLLPPKNQPFVSQMALTANDIRRVTSYERSYDADQGARIYNETVSIIPGGSKTKYGWHEATRSVHMGKVTKTDRLLDAHGKNVLVTTEDEDPSNKAANANTTESNPSLLFDRSGKWLISDFSPYRLADEMVAYYGFEPYERNKVGGSVANTRATEKSWHTKRAQVIKGKFAFTGQHYLQLESTSADHPSFFEGIVQPRDQETIYLAACWIRFNGPLTLRATVPHLRAVVHTSNGQKVIWLQSQVKHQLGDWSYLELQLDFQVIRKIYRDYIYVDDIYVDDTPSSNSLSSPEEALFRITLRVEAPAGQIMDLDHIRFAPITHDFEASIYHPKTGKPTAVIQANGLVIRTIYNHLQQEIASIDEEGQLLEFSSSSRTGKLVPSPRPTIIDAKANAIAFEPEYGSYESFDRNAWQERWKLDDPGAWLVAPGQLWHTKSRAHRIVSSEQLFDSQSAAIRCFFSLQESSALSLSWQEIGNLRITRQMDHSVNVVLPNGKSIATLPPAGELIVMLEQNYLWLWLDGVLLVDQELTTSKRPKTSPLNPWSAFALEAQGYVLVEDCLIMNQPQVTVKYYNEFSEKTQVIQLEDANTAQVSEILYDALGREAITTKNTRIKRNGGQSLLTYRPKFVTNKIPTGSQSVWHTGILQGEVNLLNPADQGYAYKRTEYEPNPLNQEKTLGLPGPDFSIAGRYKTRMSQHGDLPFLDNLFPTVLGYRQKVEHTSNGSTRISVFDQRSNLVAKYVRVPSFNHILSTYEYDTENRLIKILPPLYHDKVDTASKTTTWQQGEDHLSSEEKKWQALATRFTYDGFGNLISKITPDSGTTQYLYNAAGQMRFMVSLGTDDQPRQIVYFDYGENNQLIATGHIAQPLSLATLREHLESRYLPSAEPYQRFDHADGHFDISLRGRVKHFMTNNDGQVIIEQLRFDSQQQVMSKKAIFPEAVTDHLTDIEKQYVHGKLQKLIYPSLTREQPLILLHSYNRLGQLVGLGTADNPMYYASFTYHATGQLASEQYQPGRSLSFIRNYHYNSPGFLERISDPFLTEDIAYTSNGYGQAGYGDGMVMQATFNASWPVNADGRWFQIRKNDLGRISPVCVKALKRAGYITDSGQPIKSYVRDVETTMPLVCGGAAGRRMARLVAEKQKPTYYGHRYAYGNHQELVKAKYFTDDFESLANPLQPDSFAKEIGLTGQQSQHIWQLLTDAGYIITDQQRNDPATAVGKRGQSFFRTTNLHDDLANLNDKYTLYVEPIERLIITAISQKKPLSIADFASTFLQWQGLDLTSSRLIYNWQKGIATEIGQMLLNKGYLPSQADFTRPLNKKFTNTLHQYARFIPNIVKVLSQRFAHGLGTTPFDMESYKIDANGNHHLFHTGFDRYELNYHEASNQIESIRLGWPIDSGLKQVLAMVHNAQGNVQWSAAFNVEPTFSMEHDTQGNVVKAMHKNIQSIEYHPVSQRTTRIQLTDNRTVVFHYDTQGERALKRVFDAERKLSLETYYIRDEKGRVLLDRQTKYSRGSTERIITAYIYGPRGMLGFIRNNNFYWVTTDHSGSVRLVIKDNRVVAAYDYLPYGELMRSYGNDPQAHIVYRYTGQEWDEETGLYNYHARLYDPSIGRFYQIDPKDQYFSPYKYAGNSPLSVVDPDGEFAFLLACIVFAVVGAYLGGAAANDQWNPIDWDWKDSGTYLGMFGGAVVGGLAPLGAVASVTFIGGFAGAAAAGAGVLGTSLTATGMAVGVAGTVAVAGSVAYVSGAAANGNQWDPKKWKWDRPSTWNALFQGAATGVGLAGGIGTFHAFAKEIAVRSVILSRVFITTSYTLGGSFAYVKAGLANNENFAFWQWDPNPTTLYALIDGFDTGTGLPQNILEMGHGAGKFFKNPRKYLFSGQNKLKLIKILKNPKHPLHKTATSVVMAYLMGSSANGNFDITKWDFAAFSTYEGVLNGVFFGKDIAKTLKYIRGAKAKRKGFTKLEDTGSDFDVAKNKGNDWSERFSNEFDRIENSYAKGIEDEHFGDGIESSHTELTKYEHLVDEELEKWKAESDESSRKRLPDEEDPEFRKCSGTRRRRRSARRSVASPQHDGQFEDQTVKFLLKNEGLNDKEQLTEHADYPLKIASKPIVPRPDAVKFPNIHSPMTPSLILSSLGSALPISKSRDRRSPNNTKNYVDDLLIENTTNGNLANNPENLNVERTEHFINAPSGASRIEFWPISVVKNTGKALLSILSHNWSSSSKEEENKNLPVRSSQPSEPLIDEQQPRIRAAQDNILLGAHLDPFEDIPSNASPNLLEMGDQWIKNTDVNGLLAWGILLSRKWAGHRLKATEVPSYYPETNIKLSILSHELVDSFMDKVLVHGQACGIEKSVSDLIDDPKLYIQVVEMVRTKLVKEELNTVAEHLFEQVLRKNIGKIASKITSEKAHKLLTRIKLDLPNIQQHFFEQEGSLQTLCHDDETKEDTNLLMQEMKLKDELADTTLRVVDIHDVKDIQFQNYSLDLNCAYRKCAGI